MRMLKVAGTSAIVLLCGNLFHSFFLFNFINKTFIVFFFYYFHELYVLLMKSSYIFDKTEVKKNLHIRKRISLTKRFMQRSKNLKYWPCGIHIKVHLTQ